MDAPRSQPAGTVTLVFTDIEGSTRLLEEMGAERYRDALEAHREIVRGAFAAGYEVDTEGDAFFYAFDRASDAATAATEAIARLADGPIRIRIGIHTGEPLLHAPQYVGLDVHRAARVSATAHGGQIVLSPTTRTLLGDAAVHDLGLYLLRDFDTPVRLFQLGAGDFPPPRGLRRTNLPVPATRFMGREAELLAVEGLLTGDEATVVTLTGPGGTGKTRLALQAAVNAAGHFPDGVAWVPLAALQERALVAETIVRTLRLGDDPGPNAMDVLATSLSGRRLLLLLDNAEHLLAEVGHVVSRLRAIGGPLVLTTSRERLRVQGEHVYPVPAMSTAESIGLFTERARMLDPAFQPTADVARLCDRLDCLPLAVELAAARTTIFSPRDLIERLGKALDLLEADGEADPRQRTLRATIDWSHALLAADEQRVYAALGVFAGGCTIDVAEAVCGADLRTLQSLIDKNLLRRREGAAGSRLFMLETIREHAAERLDALPTRGQVRDAHAQWCTVLMEEALRRVTAFGVDDTVWWDRFNDERDNLRAALDHCAGPATAVP